MAASGGCPRDPVAVDGQAGHKRPRPPALRSKQALCAALRGIRRLSADTSQHGRASQVHHIHEKDLDLLSHHTTQRSAAPSHHAALTSSHSEIVDATRGSDASTRDAREHREVFCTPRIAAVPPHTQAEGRGSLTSQPQPRAQLPCISRLPGSFSRLHVQQNMCMHCHGSIYGCPHRSGLLTWRCASRRTPPP